MCIATYFSLNGCCSDLFLNLLRYLHSLVFLEVVLDRFEVSCRVVEENNFNNKDENSMKYIHGLSSEVELSEWVDFGNFYINPRFYKL